MGNPDKQVDPYFIGAVPVDAEDSPADATSPHSRVNYISVNIGK